MSTGRETHPRARLQTALWRDRYAYLLLLPGFLIFLVYRYLPMFGLMIAFKDFSFSKGVFGSRWVGLKYFIFIFTRHPDFFRILRNTVLINIYRLVFAFPVPIILALMLNEVIHLRFKRVLQTLIYLPHFVSWVIFGGIIIQFLSPSTGIVNEFIALFGAEPIFFLVEPRLFRGIIVFSHIWKNAGWGTIIYLAALAGVDPQLYDAAVIDGANRWHQIWYVTLPSISSTIVVLLLLNIGRLMYVGFEQIFVLYNPTVYVTGDVISTYVYRVGIGNARFSIATAIGMFQSVVGLTLISLSNAMSRRFFDKSIW
jgi:putative aldouronate transport system permease protein